MPKVSEEHLARRRSQILDAARACFIRNGFHATSMQHIFDESGLSAGAVYRYFAGKDEMILAIAAEGMGEVHDVMSGVCDGDRGCSMGEALAAAIETIEQRTSEQGRPGQGVGSLAIQMWSESLRNPELAEQFRRKLARTTTGLEKLVVRLQGEGRLPAEVSAESLALVIAALIPGYMVQRTMLGRDAVDGFTDALRALWR